MARKKNFDHLNPALEFINIETTSSKNDDFILSKPTEVEFKTKRLQLLIKPSTYKEIYKLAESKKLSINQIINSILESYLKDFGSQEYKI